MDDSRIKRVYDAKRDNPEAGIKAGDQVIEFVDGTVRPRMTWRQILDDLVRLPEKDRAQAIRDAAELEASVINFLSRENSPWRRRGRKVDADQNEQVAEGGFLRHSEEDVPRSLDPPIEREPSRAPEEDGRGRGGREHESRHTVKYFPVPPLPRVARTRERGHDRDPEASSGR